MIGIDFQKCYAGADSPQECVTQKEDYLECLHHTKEVKQHSPLFLSLSSFVSIDKTFLSIHFSLSSLLFHHLSFFSLSPSHSLFRSIPIYLPHLPPILSTPSPLLFILSLFSLKPLHLPLKSPRFLQVSRALQIKTEYLTKTSLEIEKKRKAAQSEFDTSGGGIMGLGLLTTQVGGGSSSEGSGSESEK